MAQAAHGCAAFARWSHGWRSRAMRHAPALPWLLPEPPTHMLLLLLLLLPLPFSRAPPPPAGPVDGSRCATGTHPRRVSAYLQPAAHPPARRPKRKTPAQGPAFA